MSNFHIPSSEEVNKLFEASAKNKKLNELQVAKFRQDCYKTYVENQGNSFDQLITAAKIYLNLILDFPDLSL